MKALKYVLLENSSCEFCRNLEKQIPVEDWEDLNTSYMENIMHGSDTSLDAFMSYDGKPYLYLSVNGENENIAPIAYCPFCGKKF